MTKAHEVAELDAVQQTAQASGLDLTARQIQSLERLTRPAKKLRSKTERPPLSYALALELQYVG
jgi:hypothetical protein